MFRLFYVGRDYWFRFLTVLSVGLQCVTMACLCHTPLLLDIVGLSVLILFFLQCRRLICGLTICELRAFSLFLHSMFIDLIVSL